MGLNGTQWDWNSMDSMGLNGTQWDSMGLHRTPSQLMGGATYLPSSACAAARRTYALRTGGGGGRCLMSLSRNVAISITRELMMEAIRGALNTAHHPRNQCSSSSQSLHIILAINAHHPRNHCTSSSHNHCPSNAQSEVIRRNHCPSNAHQSSSAERKLRSFRCAAARLASDVLSPLKCSTARE